MDEELKKFTLNAKKYEKKLYVEEKKTLSIRVTQDTIDKVSKRVILLKEDNQIPDKVTVSSYISKLVEEFVTEQIDDKGAI